MNKTNQNDKTEQRKKERKKNQLKEKSPTLTVPIIFFAFCLWDSLDCKAPPLGLVGASCVRIKRSIKVHSECAPPWWIKRLQDVNYIMCAFAGAVKNTR